MKKILTIILLFLSFIGKSQKIDYPYYYIKGNDTLGIVISVTQAQKIDNDYTLLNLLKQYKFNSDKLDSINIVINDDFKNEVAQLKLKSQNLEEQLNLKDSLINNLKDQISKYQSDQNLSNTQLQKSDEIINNYKKENRRLRFKNFLGFSVGGGSLIGIIILLLVKK